MLSTRALTKNLTSQGIDFPVLCDVTMSLERGEICALTGPSGSGKTTLMNLVGLLDRPTSGSICIDGTRTEHLTPNEAAEFRNRTTGFVFQSFHLLPHLSALDNAALPLLYRGFPKQERRSLAASALAKVGFLDRMMHRPAELSGGQRQRVAIARAIVGTPALLLADEPTGNLDSQSAEEVMSLFLDLNAEFGLTVLIFTHDPTIAARCPRRIAMRDGKIFDDNPQRIRRLEARGQGRRGVVRRSVKCLSPR